MGRPDEENLYYNFDDGNITRLEESKVKRRGKEYVFEKPIELK